MFGDENVSDFTRESVKCLQAKIRGLEMKIDDVEFQAHLLHDEKWKLAVELANANHELTRVRGQLSEAQTRHEREERDHKVTRWSRNHHRSLGEFARRFFGRGVWANIIMLFEKERDEK